MPTPRAYFPRSMHYTSEVAEEALSAYLQVDQYLRILGIIRSWGTVMSDEVIMLNCYNVWHIYSTQYSTTL